MTLQELLQHFPDARRSGQGYKARCPAHPDQTASLSLAEGEDGRVLLYCHTGCSLEAIAKAKGLEVAQLHQKPAKTTRAPRPLRTWEIRDPAGQLLAVHYRRDTPKGKRLWWERPGQKDLGGLLAKNLPLYGSQELSRYDKKEPLYLCEGEPDTDALRSLGLQAVGTVTGAKGCPSPNVLESVAPFPDVRLWPDHDSVGREHMQKVAKQLRALGCRGLSLVAPPGLPEGGGATDWVLLKRREGLREKEPLKQELLLLERGNAFGGDVAGALCAKGQASAPPPGPLGAEPELSSGRTKEELPEALEAGSLVPLETVETVETVETRKPVPTAYGLQEFLSLQIPPRKTLLSPWLREKETAMIYAWRGTGKTHVALGIAWAVASGGKFLRWEAPEARGVLFVDGENAAQEFQTRLRDLARSNDQRPTAPFQVLCSDLMEGGIPDLATKEGQAVIEAHLSGISLLVLDNLSCLHHSGEENEASSWVPFGRWLLALKRRGISTLLLHHSGKGGQQRGTSKREDALDAVLNLERPADYTPQDGARFLVKFEKNRGLHGEAVRSFEARLAAGPDGRQEWATRDVEAALHEQIVSLARSGLRGIDIAKEFGITKGAVSKHLAKARETGEL